MKRISFILKCVLFGFLALYPLGYWILSNCNYMLTLFSVPAVAIMIAALSVCIVVLDGICKCSLTNKAICALMAFLPLLSLFNTCSYLVKGNQALILISGMVCFVCCCILAIKHVKPMALKIVALILSAMMVIPAAFLSFLFVFFSFGQNTVVKTVESPNGRYYAELIDSDQGALGGDTVVYVYEKWEINLLLFKIEKKPQLVYFGDWGEFNNMKLSWKDDHCLVINSVEYEIE